MSCQVLNIPTGVNKGDPGMRDPYAFTKRKEQFNNCSPAGVGAWPVCLRLAAGSC